MDKRVLILAVMLLVLGIAAGFELRDWTIAMAVPSATTIQPPQVRVLEAIEVPTPDRHDRNVMRYMVNTNK